MASNSIEFSINIDGTAYQGIAKISEAMNDLNVKVNKTQGAFKTLGDAAFRVNAIADVFGKMSSAFSGIAKAGMDNEMLLMNMRTLYQGNAEAAQDMYDRIAEYGKQTVYDKSGLVEAQKTMMSFGIEGEKAFTTLKQIGDIAMGDSGKMQSLSLAFAQMSSTGKLTAQDLNQMINAGFNPLQEMSRTTGISIGELREKMEKGAISADMVAQAFASATSEGGLFYEGAEKGGETMAGKVAQINDTIEEFKVKIFEATGGATAYAAVAGDIVSQLTPLASLFSMVKSGAVGFIRMAQSMRVQMALLKMEIRSAGGLMSYLAIKEKAVAAATAVWNGVQTVLNALLTMNYLGIIITAIGVLIGLVIAVYKHWDTWGKKVAAFIPGLTLVIETIQTFKKHWESLKAAFKDGGIIAGLKRLGFVLFDALTTPVVKLLEALQSIPKIGGLATKALNKINNLKDKFDKATRVTATTQTEESAAGVTAATQNVATQNNTKGSKTGESIASSAPKTININIGKFFDNIQFQTTNLTESVEDIEQTVLECMGRVLLNGAVAGTQ